MAFGADCISEGVRTGRFPVQCASTWKGIYRDKVSILGVLSEEVADAAGADTQKQSKYQRPEELANPSSKYLLTHTTNAHISRGPAPKTLVFLL